MTAPGDHALPCVILGVPVYVDPHVPLTRWNPETMEEEQVAFWKYGDKILVHPDRLELIRQAIEAVRR